MITCEKLAEIFKSQELTFFTGVPCSILKDWLNFIKDNKDFQHVAASSEGEACAISTGFHLAANRIPVVYMQNSGLGNSVDPLTSLLNEEMYNIPAILLISWRGEPGTNDTPQHTKMGRITTGLLETLGIPYTVLPFEESEINQEIKKAKEYAQEHNSPYALILRKGIIGLYNSEKEEDRHILTREQTIEMIVDGFTNKEIVVSTTGKTSRELFEVRKKKNQKTETDLYTLGSMGCCSGIGLGIALQKPDKKVFVFDGDGSVLMKMGTLATIGHCGPKNFYHIVFDNNAHDSTGGQKTSSNTVDFAKTALSCGYKFGQVVSTKEQLIESIKSMKSVDGPAMLVIKVKKGARKDLSRPDRISMEYRNEFAEFIRRKPITEKYHLPTKIILGRLEENIREAVDLFNPRKILLITSGNAMKRAGVIDRILNCLSEYQVTIFDKVKPNPSPETAEQAKQDTDLIIGLGGGSVMDVAKVAATHLDKPCIVIPTTAGTGSEVTPFAALYTPEKKISFTGKYPDVALIDYRLTLTMPKELVASTGMDVLSQAIEAYWSIYSTPLTDIHAKRAIELCIKNLEASWNGDEKARESMSLAALEAGRAFSQTKTTAVHSVSYPFSVFYKIPHGLACAFTLPHFLVYNYKVAASDCLDQRGPDFVKSRIKEIAIFLGAGSVEEGKETILNLMKSINLPTKIDFDIDTIVKHGFTPERVKNNPRELTQDDLKNILKEVLS